ncbi:MAG: signal peptidase I [Oscillospiraceae bacterium]
MTGSKNNKIIECVYEWAESILFSLAVVLLIFTFALKTYMVSGPSMYPTLDSGERVFVYGLFYQPKQGDIVVIDSNNNLNEPIVKRVVATGGQTVDIDANSGEVMVDDTAFDTPIKASFDNLNGNIIFPVVVPDGYIFVMGDNRADSLDSRYSELGFVNSKSVLGKKI